MEKTRNFKTELTKPKIEVETNDDGIFLYVTRNGITHVIFTPYCSIEEGREDE